MISNQIGVEMSVMPFEVVKWDANSEAIEADALATGLNPLCVDSAPVPRIENVQTDFYNTSSVLGFISRVSTSRPRSVRCATTIL